jgi:undecaprenyl-diphosphatase
MDGDQSLPRNNFIIKVDQEVNEGLHKANQESPESVRVFNRITDFGSGDWIKSMATIVAIGLVIIPCSLVIFRGRPIRVPVWGSILALAWILVLLVGEMLNLELKNYIGRARPPYHEAAHAFGYSFPSGHSMGAFIAYGMLAYLLTLALPPRRIRQAVLAVLGFIVLLVGFSRIYLGAHWLSDVIGGFAAGACWLGFCIAAIEMIRGLLAPAGKPRIIEGAVVNIQLEPSLSSPQIVFPDKTL